MVLLRKDSGEIKIGKGTEVKTHAHAVAIVDIPASIDIYRPGYMPDEQDEWCARCWSAI